LSPAYDILPSAGFGGYHTTIVNNTGEPELSDILIVSAGAGVSKRQTNKIIDEVNEVVKFL
jgi:serine/threonine-protein kinase HipA